jgi:hypothetical protein
MLEVISLNQKGRWNEIIRSMIRYDFYHLADYHRLDCSGTPLLLYFSTKNTDLALPVVLRSIEGTEYTDITSVYGYVGPLSNRKNPDIQSVKAFQKALLIFFDSYKVVSAFARLHPLFKNQEIFLSGLGKTVDIGLTVGIDLNLPESEQRRQYAHSIKNNINRLKRKNVVVKREQTEEAIDFFIDIYQENMKRLNASKVYLFSRNYFHRFMKNLPAALFLAYYEEKAISGSLFTICNGIVQPHLSATRNDYLRWSPLKYVWDQIRTEVIKEKAEWLHLGGGVGGKKDTLFDFKAQFSNLHFPFKTWEYVHNEAVYVQLVSLKFSDSIPPSSFFPLYRL